MDLTLSEGIHLQEAIHTAKEIDQKSKLYGFNQYALDQMTLQGYGNAQFEISGEEGLEIVDEFYTGGISQQNPKMNMTLLRSRIFSRDCSLAYPYSQKK